MCRCGRVAFASSGVAYLLSLLLCLQGCTSSSGSKKELKVAATPVPHAEMLEFVAPLLRQEGIELKVLVTDDYRLPNRELAEKEVDANFFQHLPFLDEEVEHFHYPIRSFAKIELEPMGVYSDKIRDIGKVKEGFTVAVPNDPTNEGRALLLLQKHGLITLKDSTSLSATPLDIVDNPLHLKFKEADAAALPRLLRDVGIAVINTNNVLQAGMSPLQDALVIEGSDSAYVNIIAIRIEDAKRADLLALKEAMTSQEMRHFIRKKYKGAVIPAF
ncbi:MAG: MetQ/NlpA family ABC transporter substrate-binding protein [Simkaniaceae bacterium]|nr:MetQ/NlpA family ABC transporter substrate-binding protein [Simkaniaceae bacterium]